jgi:hypothetical protein
MKKAFEGKTSELVNDLLAFDKPKELANDIDRIISILIENQEISGDLNIDLWRQTALMKIVRDIFLSLLFAQKDTETNIKIG